MPLILVGVLFKDVVDFKANSRNLFILGFFCPSACLVTDRRYCTTPLESFMLGNLFPAPIKLPLLIIGLLGTIILTRAILKKFTIGKLVKD